ncbi:MAG: cysteine desulfurase family protein [Methyloligellaceae bacterium]
MTERTYLDYNATAPVRSEVREVMASALLNAGNASSVHAEGRRARALIETAREQVAGLAGADPANVIFTSGGTEANVTALAPENAGTCGAPEMEPVCIISAVEHPSVLAGGRFRTQDLQRVPVTSAGTIDQSALSTAVADHSASRPGAPLLASVMVANNETGAVQPVAEVARIVHDHGGVVHADAVQAAGKLMLDIGALGVDLMSLSAHKIGGPQGVGALVLGGDGSGLRHPLIGGGGQEQRRRAGTENVAGIVGFGIAAELVRRDLPRMQALASRRDDMESRLSEVAPELVVFARETERLPNTSCIAVPDTRAETIVIALDLAGVAVSAGSACTSGKVQRSHVLEAMGVSPDLAGAAIRISLGWETTADDVARFVAAWSRVYAELTGRRDAA